MKENKSKEILSVAMAVVLCIGLFSAAFACANHFAFAAVTGKTESITPVAATVKIPVAQIATPDDYQQPELFVYDATDRRLASNPNALSAEEAAELGALYIWAIFGESIEGKTIKMSYCVWPSHTRAYWLGEVAESKDAAENHDILYDFYICAISGERVDVHNMNPDIGGRMREGEWTTKHREIYSLLNAFMEEYRLAGRVDELDAMFAVRPTEEQLDKYGQLAKDYGAKHFIGTEVTELVFLRGGSSVDMDEDGNFVKTDKSLTFKVTDSTGRCVDVCLAIETRTLLNLSSSQYDIVPGFNADHPGAVG